MLALLIIPWVLTVVALVYIMVRKRKEEEEFDGEIPEVVKVAVYEDKAYWVYDNVFYQSEVTREPDFETARPIDTMSLSPDELEVLMSVLDELEQAKEKD